MSPAARRSSVLFVLGLCVAAATALFSCSQGPDLEPPEGWERVSETQWVRTGADTAEAFRDLSTLEAMGVRLSEDRQTRFGQEQMTKLYRTHPEVLDSLFFAVAEPILNRPYADEGYEEAVLQAVEDAKSVIVGGGGNETIYRQATPLPDPPPTEITYPDSLKQRGIGGVATAQAYVTDEGVPVAVELVESVHPVVDAMMMRKMATTRFNPAWVVEGRRGGRAIPNYVRTSTTFDPDA